MRTQDGAKIEVIPVVYKAGAYGDFMWMRKQPGYENAYFVFNDNEEQFLAHEKDPESAAGCAAGGGNAAIRPWRCEKPPRAGGVPTGVSGHGYQALTPEVRAIIDRAVARIKSDVTHYNFSRVFYSCRKGDDGACAEDGDLGTGIFNVDKEVRGYIVSKLKSIGD